jgi:uncharacterized protein YecE (DUF72 family)
MKFGRLENIEAIDFSLPPDHAGIKKVLGGQRSSRIAAYVGSVVWADENLVKKIYPDKAGTKNYVKYYGKQFNTIELNATHYRVPDKETVKRWVEAVPDDFRFCPKVHESISHTQNISQSIELAKNFNDTIQAFGNKLGTSFLQLPPTFNTKGLNYLLDFLDGNPIRKLAIELRHENWFEEGNEELKTLCNYLYKNNIALVITDVSGRRDVLHQRLTNKTTFIRFVANDLHPTDYIRMNEWVQRIDCWIQQGLEEFYFFMHSPDKGLTAELAVYFINRLAKVSGIEIRCPKIKTTEGSQLDML